MPGQFELATVAAQDLRGIPRQKACENLPIPRLYPSSLLCAGFGVALLATGCARSGCESYHYQLTFKLHGQPDWAELLLQAKAIRQEQEHPARGNAAQGRAGSSLARWLWTSRWAHHLWIALVAVLLLMLIRQWYLGGRIPLVREPEHFRVDPDPREEPAH